MSQVLDNNSSSTGILPGSFVGNITSGDQNHITFGEIHATAHKSSVDQQIANQNEANMSISDPKKVKEQKSYEKDRSPEEKKSITKIYDSVATEQSPIKLDVLLSVEFKAEKQVLQDTKKAQAELAKALINDEGQVIDSEGNIIGVAAKDGKVLNERGELIGEVSKDGSILPVRTSLFGFQMVDNTVVDERGRVLATVKDNIILGYDGELLATIDKTGQIFNIEGQEIDSSGWLLDLQGGRTAKFGLKCVEEDLIPLPNSNFPLLYDSEGQRIIGINKKGTVSVVQMNEGKGILGSSQSTKEGKKYVVWDSDKRPLSEAQVKNLIKLSAKMQNLNYESSDEEEGLLYQPDDGGLDLEEELRQIGEHRDQYLVKKTSSLVKSNLPLIPANIQDLKYSIKKPQSMSVQSIDQKHLKMGLKLTVGEKFDPLEAQRLLEEKKKSLLETKKKKKTKDDSEADPSKPKKKKKKVDEEGTVPSVKPKKKKVKEGEVADDGVAKKKKKKVDGQEKADESTNKSKLEADELAETENLKPKKKKKVKIEPMGELSEVAPKKKKVLKNSEQINEEMEVPIGAQLEGETKKPLKKPKKPLPSPKSPDPQEDRDKPDRVEEAGNVEKEIKRKKKAGDGKKAGEEVLSEITPKAQKKDKVKEIGDSQAKEKVFGESESVKEEVKVKRVLKKKVANESAEVTGKATDIKKQASDPKPANANVNNPIEGLAPADKTKKPPEVVASKDKELTKPQPRAKNAADYKIGKKIKLPEESKPTGDSSAPGKTSLEAILAKPGQKKDKLAKIDEHMPTKVGVQLLPDPKIESKEKKVKKTK
jgi:hypothetical protein